MIISVQNQLEEQPKIQPHSKDMKETHTKYEVSAGKETPCINLRKNVTPCQIRHIRNLFVSFFFKIRSKLSF